MQGTIDPTRWDFFVPRGKNWKICDFKWKFSNAKPKAKMADPTQPEQQKFDPGPSLR